MKILSIRHPFALFVADGIKRVENRSWSTNYRGLLAIHQGLKSEKIDSDYYNELKNDYPNYTLGESRPGYVIAVVDFVAILRPDPERKKIGLFGLGEKSAVSFPLEISWWDRESTGWIFQNARRIVPVQIKGQLGLFDAEIKIEYI